MSKLKMLKFEAATLQNRSKRFVEQMQKLGLVHLEKINDKRLFEASTSDSVAGYERAMSVIDEAFSILSSHAIKQKSSLFAGRKTISEDEFNTSAQNADKYLSYAYEINKSDKAIADLHGEEVRVATQLDTMRIWEKLDIPLSTSDTKYTSIFIGSFSGEYTNEKLSETLALQLGDLNEYSFEIIHSSKLVTAVVFFCHKSIKNQLWSAIRSFGFILPPEITEGSISEKIVELENRLLKIADEKALLKEKIADLSKHADDMHFAYDYYSIKSDEYKALTLAGFSSKTIYFTGYVPEKTKDAFEKLIKKNDGAVVFETPSEDDDVPVLLSNGGFSEPVESIVEMYSMPGKNDIDPSKAMAFFYYLLFGMMLSDAGYGLVLFLGSLAILKFTTVEGSMKKMLRMFVYCGISTVFWGALFGSWFGDAIPVICREFFGITKPMKVALWFDPISDPITLLLFSFVIGIFHLFLGLTLLGYTKWKGGDKIGALCDTVPIMLTVIGAAPLAAGVLVTIPASVTGIAKYIAIVGVVLIVLTTSRSGNVLVRLGGGVYALYNIASGYLSDILSYSRLLALGLATGCIGSVVNMLAVMIDTPGIKVVAFIIIFIIGHALNMAINVLGAYVHTNRLQFVELFSKFYEGGGRAFNPFKHNTKYFKLKEEIKND